MSVKSGAEVGVGVEVSLFFYCNAVLGLGLGSGLTLALTLRLNNPNLNPNLNPNPKTAFFKKKIDHDPEPAFYGHSLGTVNRLLTDTFLRRTPAVGPCRFQSFYCDFTLFKTNTSLLYWTDNGRF